MCTMVFGWKTHIFPESRLYAGCYAAVVQSTKNADPDGNKAAGP